MSTGKFPRPYVNEVRQDSIMEYVEFQTTGIGSRRSGLPKDVKSEGMNLEHVGGTAGKGR